MENDTPLAVDDQHRTKEHDECPVCKTDMCVDAFQECECDEITDNCYRLHCGHAFHTMCIMQTFRTGSDTCPVCRSQKQQSQQQNQQQSQIAQVSLNFRINPDGSLHFYDNNAMNIGGSGQQELTRGDNEEDEYIDADLLERMIEQDATLRHLRNTNDSVKQARQRSKIATKEYRRLCHTLCGERKRVISDALKNWKKERHAVFRSSFHAARKSIVTVQKEEIYAYNNCKGQDAFDALPFAEYYKTKSAEELLKKDSLYASTRKQDPLKSAFWHA
jgi:hypothetical protein